MVHTKDAYVWHIHIHTLQHTATHVCIAKIHHLMGLRHRANMGVCPFHRSFFMCTHLFSCVHVSLHLYRNFSICTDLLSFAKVPFMWICLFSYV